MQPDDIRCTPYGVVSMFFFCIFMLTECCIVLCRHPGQVTAINGPNTKCRVRLDRDMAEKW